MDDEARSVSAPVVLVCGSLLAGTLLQGAFHPPGRLVLGAGVVAALLVRAGSRRPDRRELTWSPLPVLVAGAAWTLLDAALHGSATAGLPGAALWLGVAAVLFVVRRATPAERETVVAVAAVLGGAVAVTAWLGLVLHLPGWGLLAAGLWRGGGALTYPNAAAAVLAVAALLAVGEAVPRPDAGADAGAGAGVALLPPRAATVLATLALAGLGATLSRGGVLALLAGLVAGLVAAGPRRRALARAAAGPLAGGALATAGLVPLMTGEGAVRVALAAAALAAGVLLALAVHGLAVVRRPGRSALVVTALAVGVVAGAAVLAGPQLRQVGEARLQLTSDHRAGAAAAALDLVRDHLLTGVGPGAGTVTWHESGAALTGRYLHDEYLQLLLEQGAVGAGLLVLLGAAVVRDARRAGPAPPAAAARRAAGWAATAALAVHSGLDFLWHLPALPLLGAAVVAATLSSAPAPAGHDGPVDRREADAAARTLPGAPVASGRPQGREDRP